MRRLARLVDAGRRTIEMFDPRGLGLSVGRTLLAFAELTVLLFTPDSALLAHGGDEANGVRCDGWYGISLWCVTGSGDGALLLARGLAIAILTTVAIGYRPRWTCIPHWYVTLSLNMSMSLPNGGEYVGRIVTLLLIPMCLGDDRIWQWQRPKRSMPASWRGSSYAALLALRFQIAVVYVTAAVSKLLKSEWRDGTALYAVLNEPYFGVPHVFRPAVEPVFAFHATVAAATWGVIVIEVGVAVGVLGGRKLRRGALSLAIVLHASIMVLMGLFSFGLVMIGSVTVVCAAGIRPDCDEVKEAALSANDGSDGVALSVKQG